MPRISTNKFDNPDQDQPMALRFGDISILDKISKGKNPAGIFGGKGIFLLRERPSASPPLQYKIDGWGGLSPIRPGSSPLWRGRGPSLNPGPSVDLRAPGIGPSPEISNFADCYKITGPLKKGKRDRCEAQNAAEAQRAKDLAQMSIDAQIAIARLQTQTSSQLGQLVSASQMQDITSPQPATGNSKLPLILIVVVVAAAAIGAVLYFTKKPA
jgi:hypothetical protein